MSTPSQGTRNWEGIGCRQRQESSCFGFAWATLIPGCLAGGSYTGGDGASPFLVTLLSSQLALLPPQDPVSAGAAPRTLCTHTTSRIEGLHMGAKSSDNRATCPLSRSLEQGPGLRLVLQAPLREPQQQQWTKGPGQGCGREARVAWSTFPQHLLPHCIHSPSVCDVSSETSTVRYMNHL